MITGEPIRKFQSRVRKVWEHILAENPDGSTVVVGHSGVFNALLIHYFDKNFPPGQRYYRLRPGSISQIDIHPDGKAELARLNDASHLPENLQ
jgi:broad specificity phosphatase PhoE